MKAVVLTLALLFLTGSQARHVTLEDNPESPWEQMKVLAIMYLGSAKDSGREYIARLEDTDLAKQLNLKLLENLDTLNTTVTDLREQLGPVSQKFWNNLEEKMGMLTQELNKDLEVVKTKMEPSLANIREKWRELRERTQERLQGLQERLQGLQGQLDGLGAQVRDGARSQVESLRLILEPYGEELQQCLQPCDDQLRQCLQPYGDELRRLLAVRPGGLGLAELRDKAGAQLRALRERTEPTLGKVQEELQTVWESLHVGVTGGLEDLYRKLTGRQ